MNKQLLTEFARLAVTVGVNVQKGQLLRIIAPIEAKDLVHECARIAYEVGAGDVVVDYSDDVLSRIRFEKAGLEVLKEVPQWQVDKQAYLIDKKCCMLSITSPDPDVLDGIDPQKIKEATMARLKAMKQFQYYTTNNIGQWSIVAYPNLTWAKKVFPNDNEEVALNKLAEAILKASRVNDSEDVVAVWDRHNRAVKGYAKKMNDFNFDYLHFQNSLGTDLKVGLIKDHIWEGGADVTAGGVVFNPNIPTEEVFTMPDRHKIAGRVVASKPLSYNGNLIDGFELTFDGGEVVSFKAAKNEEALKNMLDTDEGAKSLGEVALISHDSPISNLDILFYNTLFDENASCHLALGRCYPSNVRGGLEMSDEELYAKGGNNSLIHVDFMFGSADMEITGVKSDGTEIKVFKNGNFVI